VEKDPIECHGESRPPGVEPGTASKLKILVVDDSESVRDVLTTLFFLEGHLCEAAVNGRDAMEKIAQTRFDVVITDLQMPEMDGITLTRELTRRFADLPVMIMTGRVDDLSRESAFMAGAREVLEKPFPIKEITAKLQRMTQVQEPIREQRARRGECGKYDERPAG
jgi:CheY-like chemotaxis protein